MALKSAYYTSLNKRLAARRGISLNQSFEEWSSIILAEFDSEARFRFLASSGDRKRALAVLDKLDDAPGHRLSSFC